MNIGTVSTRYAKALMLYAQDTDKEAYFYRAMRSLEKSFRKQPRLREALENPVLSRRDKLTLITVAALGDEPPVREFSRFAALLLKNGRESMLQYICLSFLDLYRKEKNITVGRLITAVPVSEEVKRRIRQGTSHRLKTQAELLTEVDPEIEGGFILDINGLRLDASVATQLKSVKRQFIDKNRRIV